jgi:hypothetical protein
MSSGHLGWGIFLAVYGVVAVSSADSVIRPWFIARGAQLPFLLTVLGVLGGASAFGLIGIFLGPVLLGIGYTLVNEWSDAEEAMTLDHEGQAVVKVDRWNRTAEALVGLRAAVALIVAVLFITDSIRTARSGLRGVGANQLRADRDQR